MSLHQDFAPPDKENVDCFPLGLYIYADKSKLSSFGTVTGYPVIARMAILPRSIRNSSGFGGAFMIGWLPDVSHPFPAFEF